MDKSASLSWIRKHALGLGFLVLVVIVSMWAVKHYSRPGQMTVIESQAMDMTAMKPPVGAVPVATEIVSKGSFSAKVRYTGSVAAFNEQDIFPRIEGWLTGLKVYNGDSVHAGQVLAVLDAPDVQNKLAEAGYGHIAALKEVPVSQANLARMRAELNAAKAEVSAARMEADASRAMLAADERMVNQAEQEVKASQASLNYWRAEFKREDNLLKAGAVSQQEFDSEQSQMIAAEADLESKKSKVEEARANADAARAEVGTKESMIQAAREREAAASSGISGAAAEVSQKAAMANVARAARVTAASVNDFRQLRAPFKGIVTKRYLSPGVLVTPGTPILNIAQIDKVRLQANVAEKDLGSMSVGSEVIARFTKGSGRTIRARVTSVSPSADQTSRTAVVEAVVGNIDHYLVPGDFVTMEIATSVSTEVVTVPNSALTTKDGRDAVWTAASTTIKGGKTVYYCTMHPDVVSDKPGLCPKCKMPLEKKQAETGTNAHLVYVTIGRSDGDRTEILSGLNPGDEVIYMGGRYLREGDAVTPTKWGEEGPSELPAPPSGAADMEMPGMGGKSPSEPAKNDGMHNMPGM